MINFCKNCIWHHHDDVIGLDLAGDHSICAHPKNVKRLHLVNTRSLVTGMLVKRELTDFDFGYCCRQRKFGYIISFLMGYCGKSGRWFKQK